MSGFSVETILKAADQSLTADATLTPDADFALAVGPNDVWLVEMWLLIGATDLTEDIVYGWTLPAGGTFFWGPLASNNSYGDWGAVLIGTTKSALESGSSQNAQTGLNAVTHNGLALVGIYYGGGTGGTLQFNWAQNASDAGTLTVKKNSVMRATRLGL